MGAHTRRHAVSWIDRTERLDWLLLVGQLAAAGLLLVVVAAAVALSGPLARLIVP